MGLIVAIKWRMHVSLERVIQPLVGSALSKRYIGGRTHVAERKGGAVRGWTFKMSDFRA